MPPDLLATILPIVAPRVVGDWLLDETQPTSTDFSLRVQMTFSFLAAGTVHQESFLTTIFRGAVSKSNHFHEGLWTISGELLIAQFPTHREPKPHCFVLVSGIGPNGHENEALINPRALRPLWRIGAA